jgi:formyltetrahydrofolate-dependent phosphoribosylglycinamide formyltransferase
VLRPATPDDPLRLGVLVSGTGTNLQVLLDTFNGAPREARVVAVASTRPGVRALERAAAAGVPHDVFPRAEARDARLADWLEGHRVELAVCAGWMGILTRPFLDRHVAINLHPALLPSFPGAHAVAEALAHGVRVTGVTVHLVDDGVDSGPILLQAAVPVHYDDDPETLGARLHEAEHRLLPRAVTLLATDRVELTGRRARVIDVEDS